MKLTKESLEKSLEICEKATPGPWSGFECGSWGDGSYGIAIGENLEDWFSCKQFNLNGSSNALFIAHHNPEFIKEFPAFIAQEYPDLEFIPGNTYAQKKEFLIETLQSYLNIYTVDKFHIEWNKKMEFLASLNETECLAA